MPGGLPADRPDGGPGPGPAGQGHRGPRLQVGTHVSQSFLPAFVLERTRGPPLTLSTRMSYASSQNDGSVNRRIMEDLASPQPQVKILYVTPERLDSQQFFDLVRGLHARGHLALLAVDEVRMCIRLRCFRPGARSTLQALNISSHTTHHTTRNTRKNQGALHLHVGSGLPP